MKSKNAPKRKTAREMTEKEILSMLEKVGKGIHKHRKASFSSSDDFSFQIHLSRSNMARAEKGNDLKLSTVFKILAGLEMSAAEFFKDIGI